MAYTSENPSPSQAPFLAMILGDVVAWGLMILLVLWVVKSVFTGLIRAAGDSVLAVQRFGGIVNPEPPARCGAVGASPMTMAAPPHRALLPGMEFAKREVADKMAAKVASEHPGMAPAVKMVSKPSGWPMWGIEVNVEAV
jgi:hypothetical protein